MSIQVGIGPGGDRKKAIERIALFQKEFPNEPNPYIYYLKPAEERIADVFSRISYYYVNGLMVYVNAQFPLLNLVSRPIVEVRKTRDGKYRVVGSYRGEVIFNQDRLKDVFLTLWYHNDQWSLVETNVTKERAKWAQAEKNRLKDTALDAASLVMQLETVFSTEFPKQALHDPVPRRESATTSRGSEMAPVPLRNQPKKSKKKH